MKDSRFAIMSGANIIFKRKDTGKIAFYTKDSNSFTFKMGGETVYAKASGNKAIAFEGEITAELKIEYEVIQLSHLALILASEVKEKDRHNCSRSQQLTVNSSKQVVLKNVTPVTGSVSVFLVGVDGQTLPKELQINGTQNKKDYEITITSSDINEGDTVFVAYLVEMPKAKVVTMSNESFSPNYEVEADVSAKTVDGKMMVLHLSVKNAKAKRNAELTFSAENPSKYPIEMDCFPDKNGIYAELTFVNDGESGEVASLYSTLDTDIPLKKNKEK